MYVNAWRVATYAVWIKFLNFAEEKTLKARAKMYRKASVSKSTLKSRKKQWKCYVKVCKKFHWSPYNVTAAKHVSMYLIYQGR